jgi:hypothetical protein
MNARRLVTLLGISLSVAACSPDRTTASRTAPESVPAIAADAPQVGATGIPIDPDKKKVVVITPSGAERTREQAMAELQAQNAKTGAEIAARMQTYSENLDSNEAKARLAAEMADDLDAYKKQSLEMYKLQQAPRTAGDTRE